MDVDGASIPEVVLLVLALTVFVSVACEEETVWLLEGGRFVWLRATELLL